MAACCPGTSETQAQLLKYPMVDLATLGPAASRAQRAEGCEPACNTDLGAIDVLLPGYIAEFGMPPISGAHPNRGEQDACQARPQKPHRCQDEQVSIVFDSRALHGDSDVSFGACPETRKSTMRQSPNPGSSAPPMITHGAPFSRSPSTSGAELSSPDTYKTLSQPPPHPSG